MLYGTDLEDDGTKDVAVLTRHLHETWLDDWKYFTSNEEMTSVTFRGSFKALHLPKVVVNKIFRENAIKWYKLPENTGN